MNVLEKIFSLPKSLYFNLKVLPFWQACKLPILIKYNTHITSSSGRIIILDNIRFNMISIGFGNVGIFNKKYSPSIIELKGKIQIKNNCHFGHGCKISVGPNGILTIKENFSNTAEGTIICFDKINIGNNCLMSWNTLIMDTDFHETIDLNDNIINPKSLPITINDNVWICNRAIVLKGSYIPDGCIIGTNSLVNKKFTQENCLLAGNPSKIKKTNIKRL